MMTTFLRTLAFAALLMLAGALMSLTGNADEKVLSYVISISVALLFVSMVMYNRHRNEPIRDERTVKIGRKALSYSWSMTYVLIAILVLVQHFEVAQLTVEGVLGMTFFFMVASYYLAYWHLGRKADTE